MEEGSSWTTEIDPGSDLGNDAEMWSVDTSDDRSNLKLLQPVIVLLSLVSRQRPTNAQRLPRASNL